VAYQNELEHETLRVYERYAVEVVEQFGFCPWARSARESQAVALRVIFSTNPQDFADSLVQLKELSCAQPDVEIALLIYPLLDLGRLDFEDFARRLRNADEMHTGAPGAFAMAAFHPNADADTSHPDRLVPYVRRTPDPTLQLVRKSVLFGIKGLDQGTAFVDIDTLSASGFHSLHASPPTKPVRERIAEQNLTTVLRVGSEVLGPLFEDIQHDRERVHIQLQARYGQRGPCHLRRSERSGSG
jgi:hypothetical protein